MGLLANAVASTKAIDTLDLFREIYGGRAALTGKTINIETAVQVSAVFGCARVLGEGLAQVPLKIMQETPDGRSRNPAKKHPLYNVLNLRPNPWQTSFEFREMMGWHLTLNSNFFAFKNVVFGKIKELIPFTPGSVLVTRNDDLSLTYKVTAENGTQRDFTQDQIWHVRGPSWNGWFGLEAVKIAREAIGLALATEEQHSRLHANGVRNSGVWSVEGTLSPKQHEDLTEWVQKNFGGVENAGKPVIIDRGAKFLTTAMTGVDAQHLETRKHQVEEICRFCRVNPIMLFAESKNTTYGSAEQMFLSHVVHTLAPLYQRVEQSIDVNLLTPRDLDAGYYSQFVEEGLLRGSIEATANVLNSYVKGGVMTKNEARAKLDLNPDSDPESDKLLVLANITGKNPQGAAQDANQNN